MKTKILCILCAVTVLLLSFGIFVGAAHINADVAGRDDAIAARGEMSVMGQKMMPRIRSGIMGGARDGAPEDTLPGGGIDGNGGMNGTENGTPDGGIMGDNFPNGGADAPGDGENGGTADPDGGVAGEGTGDTSGENDLLPDTNVPDSDIGGAVEDNDNDGISDPKDTDDDGDGLPDAVDPDADGDTVDDTDETTGVVGIVIAVIIVVAVIAVIFALMPKKKK